MARGLNEGQALDKVAERLAARYPHTPLDTITSLVRQTHRKFAGRPIRDYVPVLVEHEVREHLDRASSRMQV